MVAKAIVVIMLVLTGSTSVLAARPGSKASMVYPFPIKPDDQMMRDQQEQHQAQPLKSFRYGGRAFGFLPKGSKVPPSGPSKRHNSAVASTPKN
ncbi:hypothetical protein SAY87_028927 [Trapa incisa]|uniref:Uncharacterized protein n=2 Tax=Trapa TaxID=22665 RepID=A0AAN7R691_TRANT|nr:hypothetical protein SAY87_028927 [Trapa incisa]KAK4789905.1 hypothetical protein SAY86_017209 [Trapa natans]